MENIYTPQFLSVFVAVISGAIYVALLWRRTFVTNETLLNAALATFLVEVVAVISVLFIFHASFIAGLSVILMSLGVVFCLWQFYFKTSERNWGFFNMGAVFFIFQWVSLYSIIFG